MSLDSKVIAYYKAGAASVAAAYNAGWEGINTIKFVIVGFCAFLSFIDVITMDPNGLHPIELVVVSLIASIVTFMGMWGILVLCSPILGYIRLAIRNRKPKVSKDIDLFGDN